MDDSFDYVIVGSGAGGGTLAARLVEAGMRVCVLEAGSDARAALAGERLPEDYEVPAFHPFASENTAMAWNFFVEHYGDPERQARDWKRREGGILYPRAGTLGGCTAHNAMILIRPHDSDWNRIARVTGDASWRARNMNKYFRSLEECRHRPFWRWLARKTGLDPTGHGWSGWLPTELALPSEAFGDDELVHAIRSSARTIWRGEGGWFEGLLNSVFWALDPNNHFMVGRRMSGVFEIPLSTDRGVRRGTRERLCEVACQFPGKLHIELNALATRVFIDERRRATGVEYLTGRNLYGAAAGARGDAGKTRTVRADREVILAGGAFNTPQLLMLSGIGPAADLAHHGIRPRIDLPGVGSNLQDRYEIGVVHRMTRPWSCLAGARFVKGDRLYREWQEERAGMYRSNGSAIAFTRTSAGRPRRLDPDLFFMALLTKFRGYYPGYSDEIRDSHDYLTWAVLKAHTANRAGKITLRSADPTSPPDVNFHYFGEGGDAKGEDLRAVIDGIRFVRKITGKLRRDGLIGEEELPGEDVKSDAALADFVRDNAWGHHASCSCAIGPRDAGGVLSADFAVHGAERLRVVDASVFPRIPGFFIASAVYMVAEKAADVILTAAGRT